MADLSLHTRAERAPRRRLEVSPEVGDAIGLIVAIACCVVFVFAAAQHLA